MMSALCARPVNSSVGRFLFTHNMCVTPVGRAFAGIASLMFVVAAVFITRIGFHIEMHDGNYALVYAGFGVWLECIYLAIHFLLQATLRSRLSLAGTISRVLALLALLPIGLIVMIEALLVGQYLLSRQDYSVDAWVFAVLVLLLLVIPWLFMFRFAAGLFLRQRAQHGVGPERG